MKFFSISCLPRDSAGSPSGRIHEMGWRVYDWVEATLPGYLTDRIDGRHNHLAN
jgi:hypothetical protein